MELLSKMRISLLERVSTTESTLLSDWDACQ